jgi:hypothetical protein
MSWLPTLRIARAAWRGRQDPAGLIKAQLSGDQPAQAWAGPAAPAGPPAAPVAPAAAAVVKPVAVAVAEPVAPAEPDATHAHLLLLLR